MVSAGYSLAQIMLNIIERCGDNPTRDNVMYEATHMHNVEFPVLLPGITSWFSATKSSSRSLC